MSRMSGFRGALPEEDAALHEPLFGKDAPLPQLAKATDRQGKKPGTARKKFYRAKTAPAFSDEMCNPKMAPEMLPFRDKHRSSKVVLYALVVLFVYLGAGVMLFYWAANSMRGKRTSYVVDALYFSIVTMTTVGYGDLTPATPAAKFFTCIYLLIGFGLVGAMLTSAAQYLVVKQELFLFKAITRKDPDLAQVEQGSYTTVPARHKVLVTGILVLLMVSAGMVVLMTVEKKSAMDAVYVVCVTVTTLGYGDNSFETTRGRLFASAWILLSTLCVTQFFLSVAEMRTEARQKHLADWVLTRRTTISDLEAADIDEDGKVSASDFIVYKLKELGKIDQFDILKILKEFRQLDVDESGTLSAADLNGLIRAVT